jgi:hypothetical protein
MLIILFTLPLVLVATRAGLALRRVWRSLPRDNRDFGMF